MARRKKTSLGGCALALFLVLLAAVVLGAVVMGAMVDAARSKIGAMFGYSSSGDASGVDGLDSEIPTPDGWVDGLPAWSPTAARTVDAKGIRKGLIYYPRIAGATPFPYIDRAISWNLDQVLNEFPMKINYTFRPTWKQRQLWHAHLAHTNPNGCLEPGTSIHEAGFAIDTNFRSISRAEQLRKILVFHKFGFQWKGHFTPKGLGGDPVHFEIRPERAGWRSAPEAIRYNQRVYRQLSGDTR